jgi:glutathione-independent formaldehyde dehydrogenase
VFLDSDPRAVGEPESHGTLSIPWGPLFKKGVRIGMGRDHDERYNARLRDLITTGQARPSKVVSHRLTLDDAPDAFRRFDERRDGYLKVILSPDGT